MNVLRIKNANSPQAVIDGLIADFGLKSVLLALATRIWRRGSVPDSADFPGLANQPGLEHLSDHLRRDLGLPHDTRHKISVDPIMLVRHSHF